MSEARVLQYPLEGILDEPGVTSPSKVAERPHIRGKFIYVGDEKFWVRGVTYGTFAPGADGTNYPSNDRVEQDFAAMARAGLNAVRVYTVPSTALLDAAARNGLRVMIGIPWEQHISFLDPPRRAAEIVSRLVRQITHCAGHPAVLCYAVGNEIPASVVRWYGHRRVESFLARMTRAIRRLDPTALVTYVNFPTTEYLELPFVDFLSFNVYLESDAALSRYLARLQNLAGERPLLMAEVGLDSRRNGEVAQANVLRWQIETSFAMGCAGVFIFAWTDEWHRGGFEIEDWDFGLTTRKRVPKPALAAVRNVFRQTPFPHGGTWPRVSVVVCSYNGEATIWETLAGLEQLDYPNFEVIVVNDGSTDRTREISESYNVRLINTENHGLSSARNTGLAAATGSVIAYIDDDAYPDPDWLSFLVASLERTCDAAMGGPNISPYGDGDIAQCVANAPGGPLHILLDDMVAEHIPGCNMAFRKDALTAVGGFDTQFRVAGDDVDLCWRIQEQGGTIGFCAAAVVWHHRRSSVKAYLRQQRGYAKAEALLAAKWPEKYNRAGHLSWQGRIYGRGLIQNLFSARRIYHGTWGGALFQSVYEPAQGVVASLPLMPEWYVLVLVLTALAALGLLWTPLLWIAPLAIVAIGLTLYRAVRSALSATYHHLSVPTPRQMLKLRATTASLHLIQPVARLLGRIQHGLGPWRRTRLRVTPFPRPRSLALWSERWQAANERLDGLRQRLQTNTTVVVGGNFDRWEFTVHGGLFGSLRAIAMTEEHGQGKQLLRLRSWPLPMPAALIAILLLGSLGAAAAADHARLAAIVLGAMALAIAWLVGASCAAAEAHWEAAVADYAAGEGLVKVGPD